MVFQIEYEFPKRGIRCSSQVIHPAYPVDDFHMSGDIPVCMQQVIIRIVYMSRFGIYPVQFQDLNVLYMFEIIKAFHFNIESSIIKPRNMGSNL